MLEVSGLSVSYGRHLALSGAALSVARGEIVAMLGANGAGKSTLLKAVAGMVAAHPGARIELDGRSLVGQAPHHIVDRGLALVPEGRGRVRRAQRRGEPGAGRLPVACPRG